MEARRAAIGTIKLFDPVKKRGVITPQDIAVQRDIPEDLYFEVNADQARRLRVGQLVQFVVEGAGKEAEAKDVNVLSELA